mgnify:CR=1 FL=1
MKRKVKKVSASTELTDTQKQRIMKEMGRGVTLWDGRGAYTSKETEVLYVAINKYEESQIEAILHEMDPHAFVSYISGVKIHGGFEKRL